MLSKNDREKIWDQLINKKIQGLTFKHFADKIRADRDEAEAEIADLRERLREAYEIVTDPEATSEYVILRAMQWLKDNPA